MPEWLKKSGRFLLLLLALETVLYCILRIQSELRIFKLTTEAFQFQQVTNDPAHRNRYFRSLYRAGAPSEKLRAELRADGENGDNAYCDYLLAARMLDEARELRAYAKKNGDPTPGGAIQKTGEAVILLLEAGEKKQFDPGFAAEAEARGYAAEYGLSDTLERNALYAANNAMTDSLPQAFELTQYLERSVRNRSDADAIAFLDHENGRWLRFVELILNAPEQTWNVWRTAEIALKTGARAFPDAYRAANAPDRAAEIENWYANALLPFPDPHCVPPDLPADRLNEKIDAARWSRLDRAFKFIRILEDCRLDIAWGLLPALALWLVFAFCSGRRFKTAAACFFAVAFAFPLLCALQTRIARKNGFYYLPPPDSELALEAVWIRDSLTKTRSFLRGKPRPLAVPPKYRAGFFNGFKSCLEIGADGSVKGEPFRFVFDEDLPEHFRTPEYLVFPLDALALEKSKFEPGDPAGTRFFPQDAEFTVSPGPVGTQVKIRIRDRANAATLPTTVYWDEADGRIQLNPPFVQENNPFIREVPESFAPRP